MLKDKKIKQRILFSVSLLSVIAISFILGYLAFPERWECRACVYDSGNILPLVNEDYFNVTFNEINKAESNIDIVLYEFKWYDTNNSVSKLRELLIEKQNSGVKIRLLLDQSKWYGEITELSKSNEKTGNYLAEKGISVKFDSLTQTTHNKLLIIDEDTVILGSHNWGSSALTKNNEASVMIKDKEIAEYYGNYFEYLWENA